MRATEIAREMNINVCTVHHRLNRMGIQRRTVGLSPSQILEAKRLYESGESLRQIGFTIGFHDKTVKKALVDAGVDVQDRRRKHSQPRLLRSAPGCGGVGSVKMHEPGCGCASAR